MVTILVSAKANETRLNNLILLIAISYTISSFQVQKIKNKGVQEYISRTNEKRRKERRHSPKEIKRVIGITDKQFEKLVGNT